MLSFRGPKWAQMDLNHRPSDYEKVIQDLISNSVLLTTDI